MPAAAKIEKPAVSGEITNGKGKIASNNSNGTLPVSISSSMLQEPPKIANSVIEKKIRNLEKRKSRLLEIKALEDKGQQLEADQKNAVKKLDNVVEMIDMLKEIGKNLTDGLNEHAKLIKKQQKKEQLEKQAEKQQQDLNRAKLWLNVQFIHSRFSLAKNDLLQGENGAIKLDENFVDSLEKLFAVFSPVSFNLIDSCAEKVNNFLEGNKREFVSGVLYSDVKETIVKLIDSTYFENINTTDTPIESTNNVENDKQEETRVIDEPVQNNSEVIPEQVETMSIQNNVHQLANQLCFMRDPVVENELQHKDPAVVAVASSGFPYPPQIGQALSTSSGSNIVTSNSNHYSPHIYPAATLNSIPSQTFTNPNYTYIPVTLPAQIQHPIIPESHIPIRNVGPDVSNIVQNEVHEITNEKSEFLSEQIQSETQQTSQDADVKATTNGHAENGHYKRNVRGNRGGNSRGNFGNNYGRGRGGKSFGYFNGGNNGHSTGPHNGSANFNSNRPVNRQNGGGNRSGFNRQDRGTFPRNQNYNQTAPVSAK